MSAVRKSKPEQIEPWPRGVDRTVCFSIGQVVSRLKKEFPSLSVSKVRFLEEQKIVSPTRSGSGYRKYSEADVARIRYCLTEQRDRYKPIRVIAAQLAKMDSGYDIAPVPVARVISDGGEVVAPARADGTLTVAELSSLTGVDSDSLEAMVSAGLINLQLCGRFDKSAIDIVRSVKALNEAGISTRNLRSVRVAAERACELIDHVVTDKGEAGAEQAIALSSQMSTLLKHLVCRGTNQSSSY